MRFLLSLWRVAPRPFVEHAALRTRMPATLEVGSTFAATSSGFDDFFALRVHPTQPVIRNTLEFERVHPELGIARAITQPVTLYSLNLFSSSFFSPPKCNFIQLTTLSCVVTTQANGVHIGISAWDRALKLGLDCKNNRKSQFSFLSRISFLNCLKKLMIFSFLV